MYLFSTAYALVCTHPSSWPSPIHKTLKVKFKVDDVVDAIAVVDQTSVSADEDVTVATGWRR
jgi:hypothetical protein